MSKYRCGPAYAHAWIIQTLRNTHSRNCYRIDFRFIIIYFRPVTYSRIEFFSRHKLLLIILTTRRRLCIRHRIGKLSRCENVRSRRVSSLAYQKSPVICDLQRPSSFDFLPGRFHCVRCPCTRFQYAPFRCATVVFRCQSRRRATEYSRA